MAPPARRASGRVGQQVDVGEADRVAGAPPLDEHVARSARPGRAAGASSSSGDYEGHRTVPEAEPVGERPQPLPEVDRTTWSDARRRSSRDMRALARRRPANRSRSVPTRCRPGPRGRLGVDEGELADVRQVVLARVADLDGEHRVALGDGAQLRQPVARAAEVDTRTTRPPGCAPRGDAPERGSAGCGRSSPAAPSASRSGGEQPSSRPRARRAAADGGRSRRRTSGRRGGCPAAWPGVRRRSRRPRRRPPCGDRRCRTSSRARRRAAATWSARAPATSTRTCGTVIRAVAFQSMRPTSSPGSYGRTCASSMPPPRSRRGTRRGTRPRIRRPTRGRARAAGPRASGPDPAGPGRGSERREGRCSRGPLPAISGARARAGTTGDRIART